VHSPSPTDSELKKKEVITCPVDFAVFDFQLHWGRLGLMSLGNRHRNNSRLAWMLICYFARRIRNKRCIFILLCPELASP
jgi:hypothetical protein